MRNTVDASLTRTGPETSSCAAKSDHGVWREPLSLSHAVISSLSASPGIALREQVPICKEDDSVDGFPLDDPGFEINLVRMTLQKIHAEHTVV